MKEEHWSEAYSGVSLTERLDIRGQVSGCEEDGFSVEIDWGSPSYRAQTLAEDAPLLAARLLEMEAFLRRLWNGSVIFESSIDRDKCRELLMDQTWIKGPTAVAPIAKYRRKMDKASRTYYYEVLGGGTLLDTVMYYEGRRVWQGGPGSEASRSSNGYMHRNKEHYNILALKAQGIKIPAVATVPPEIPAEASRLLNAQSTSAIHELTGAGWEFMLRHGDVPEAEAVCWEADFTREKESGLWDNHQSGISLDANAAVMQAYDHIKQGRRLKPLEV